MIIVIPARMAATRLPGKPMKWIGSRTVIEHVALRALEADVGKVYVASSDAEILQHVADCLPCYTVKTSDTPLTGTDRVAEAVSILGYDGDMVMNLQGDMPFVDPRLIKTMYDIGRGTMSEWDVFTAHSPLDYVATHDMQGGQSFYRARVFRHIGIYVYKMRTLVEFANTPPNEREDDSKLEQHRLLNARWQFLQTPHFPLEVNTQEDLDLLYGIVSGAMR